MAMSSRLKSGERSVARHDAVPDAISQVRKLHPEGIVICHSPTFEVLSEPLRAAELNLLHSSPLPFPLGNKRVEFVRIFPVAIST